ncbi:41338_t:CDS:2, partial [Gigaspora margarita]
PVKLTNGNLVFECPVPKSLLKKVKYTKSEEFTDIRYTAITCDPDEFEIKKYLIRQKKYKRDTEIMIVITMYNENDTLFIKTMSSVIKNVAYICSKESWGDEGWQKIVVLIVSDGRNKINKRTLNVLSAMGYYQDGIMQDCVKKKAVTAHLFEYTTQLIVNNDFNIKGKDYNILPVQVMFCLKEINAKKLNSHHWSFNAFAPLLNPNICILLDVGTKPSQTLVYHLWKENTPNLAFNSDPRISGACGEIKVDLGHKCRNLLNPLIASQNFEYKMSNILDKPSESVFGYISVLPGAFSTYRYKAIINGPLESYFKGEHGLDATKTGIFEANMYLAEDRILSFELVIKKNKSWKLKYVKSAKAETDVPDNVPEFISQRRRWLNGSFFTAFYSISKFTLQYLLLVPSYVNIIMIYAFCNTHDVLWGTKGDNINIGNLNRVLLTEEDPESVKINIIEEGEDKNAAYENIIQELKNKDHEEKKHRNNIIKKDDYYRLFRTNFVLSWIFTNVDLINRCKDSDQNNRPLATTIVAKIVLWLDENITKTLVPKPLSSETLVPETFSLAICPLTNETLSPAIRLLTNETLSPAIRSLTNETLSPAIRPFTDFTNNLSPQQ